VSPCIIGVNGTDKTLIHLTFLVLLQVIWGWGRNECHQLASNLLDDVALPTVLDLPKHSPVISAATGKSHTLFLYADGSVYAIGK
jgi:alpha-tubulin suppressor-like RCC1 family protein